MQFDRILENLTIFTVRTFLLMDRHGADVATVVAKITWSIPPDGVVRLVVPQRPIRLHDEMLTEEPWSSLRYPTDRVDEKPGTDILMVGTAHPPNGKRLDSMDVRLRVLGNGAELSKSVRVFGPRVFTQGVRGLVPSKPMPLTPTPLIYEFAAGGADMTVPDDPLVDTRNPAGVGHVRDKAKLVGTRAPQIENLLKDSVGPAGFGAIAQGWSPRRERSGTHDAEWAAKRAPIVPKDFDPHHNCCANPDLRSETPLLGTEAIEVVGATPEGVWRFKLPEYTPVFESKLLGHEVEQLPTHLDTMLIDADNHAVELSWRASVVVPRKAQRLEKLCVREAKPLPREIRERVVHDRERYDQQHAEDALQPAMS